MITTENKVNARTEGRFMADHEALTNFIRQWQECTLPKAAWTHAAHVAVAAVNGIDFLLTWNLRHLANAALRGKIEQACRKAGFVPPIICTPEELMEPKS